MKLKAKSVLQVMAVVYVLFFNQTILAEEGKNVIVFDQICEIVEDNFYDNALVKEQLLPIKDNFRKEIAKTKSSEEFSVLVNQFLSKLKTSHTSYFTSMDPEFYQLGSIFWRIPKIKALFNSKPVKYPSLGMFTEKIDGKTFVSCVLTGGPADEGGVLRGDEILAIDGSPYSPIQTIQTKVGKQVSLSLRREINGDVKSIVAIPKLISPKEEMLHAQQKSIRIIKKGKQKIGYIEIYSYAGEEYHEALVEAISWGELNQADALIIDIRYGLGGANPSYLNLFNNKVPSIEAFGKSGNKHIIDSQWRKPAVYLVNGKTRSGKEILAFGAKKFNLATVIGEKTAGAVTGGALFPLKNGALLYLAVEGCKVDGKVIEGEGVLPDILVPEEIRYSKGKDMQLEKAIDFLVQKLQNPETVY